MRVCLVFCAFCKGAKLQELLLEALVHKLDLHCQDLFSSFPLEPLQYRARNVYARLALRIY